MEVKKTLSQKSFRMQILRPHRLLIPITMKIVAATPKVRSFSILSASYLSIVSIISIASCVRPWFLSFL